VFLDEAIPLHVELSAKALLGLVVDRLREGDLGVAVRAGD
jgi:hypothetical protein